jgi:virginiamycin B lyase
MRLTLLAAILGSAFATTLASAATLQEYDVPKGSGLHDVAPAADGGVWYTAQRTGELGYLDPRTGKTRHIKLGDGSAPHGVIVGADGAAWVTDGGLNAMVRVDAQTSAVKSYPLPPGYGYANLNTAAFDGRGVLWFTGQSGTIGWLDPRTGRLEAGGAPRGRGPYGIAATPKGEIWYASLAGNHLAQVDGASGQITIHDPPTPRQGARRVWSDSKGRLWVSEWLSGQVSMYDPANKAWRAWKAPGGNPKIYAVYVDERDHVWLSDWDANTMLRFLPETETFDVYPIPSRGANVRQILGRKGEVWCPESGTDKILLIRTE